jgi:hypothetical protein
MATAILAFDILQSAVGRAPEFPMAGVPGPRNLVESILDSDHSLIARCLAGDEAAWEDLVRLHSRQVYGLCFRFTGSGPEART